jgi:hypothetical protein
MEISWEYTEESRGQPTRGDPLALRLGMGLRTPHHKNNFVMKCYTGNQTCMNHLEKLPHLAQDGNRWRALANTVTNLWVSQNVGKFSSS